MKYFLLSMTATVAIVLWFSLPAQSAPVSVQGMNWPCPGCPRPHKP